MSKQKLVGIVCHDAGGAEVVSSYVIRNNLTAGYYLQGPAISIFERKLGIIKNSESLFDLVKNSDWLLCGTSWQSNLEWSLIQEAKKQGKKVISFLDHWVNYQERFTRNNNKYLPDEIWVGDVYSEKIAKKHFPESTIKLVENPYLLDIKKHLLDFKESNSPQAKPNSVLYICDPIREYAYLQHGDENYWGYTEESALQYFLSNTDHELFSNKNIVIRPHPSEHPDKYHWVHAYYGKQIEINNSKSLIHHILNSQIVVGCESMAMVIALMAGKKVISSIPKGGKPCVLPHKEIKIMRDLM